MCNCGGGKKRDTWLVTFPDGNTTVKHSEIAAKLAANKVDGATYKKVEAAG